MSHYPPPHPHGLVPEGTNAPPPVRAQAQAQQQAQDKAPAVKTRSALLTALGLPDLPGLPSHEVLLTAIIGQRVQDRALWLLVGFMVLYTLGHGLFGVGPCPDSTTLETILDMQNKAEQAAKAGSVK